MLFLSVLSLRMVSLEMALLIDTLGLQITIYTMGHFEFQRRLKIDTQELNFLFKYHEKKKKNWELDFTTTIFLLF